MLPRKHHHARRPPELARHYEAQLVQQNMVTGQRMHDHQWLRYYLDFCSKYRFAPTVRQSFPAFQDFGYLGSAPDVDIEPIKA